MHSTETTENDLSESIAVILEQVNKALRNLDLETEPQTERDVHTKKLITALGHLVATVLENTNMECHPALTEATNKLEQHVRMTQRDCIALIPPLLAACCRQHQEGVLLHDLITKLTAVMGVIDEENSRVSESDSFVSVDDKTSQIVLGYACAHMVARFKHAEHLLSQAKDLQLALKCCTQFHMQKIDKELKEIFKCLVVQLSQMSSWCGKLAKLQFPVGLSSDKILQTCTRLYALLAAFMKQLIAYVGHDAALLHPIRLERLLKLSGKKLSTVIDNAITYVEASQGRRGGAGGGGGAGVLKDTRHIPRLVLEVERFSEYCLLLSHNTKVDLQQYLSLGTARDFRIKAPALQEALAQELNDTRPDDDAVDDDAETVLNSPIISDEENSSGGEESQPKKRKTR
ncbi:Fanconi anemia group I protein homolog [Eumeta japonica]|uniref:Fanconi anemia group I protein homolog n=1 Tax=Eumeta variegata TaxID=151549 RepID=A0A4C1W8L5_EUMVA|nr:Fanconi anemia group I protein homolog [Eumeta japonica]